MVGASAVVLWYGRRRYRSLFSGRLWLELFGFQYLTAVFAVLGSPTFLRGIYFIKEGVSSSQAFDQELVGYFGVLSKSAPWSYYAWLFVCKLTPGLAALVVVAAMFIAWERVRGRAVGPLIWISFLALAPSLPLATKALQNAQYHLGMIVTSMVIAAAFVDRMRRRGGYAKVATLSFALVALVVQAWMSVDLWPDPLQAGRHLGARMQGMFWGPAVNHCQGGPPSLAQLNALTAGGEATPAYVFGDCVDVLEFDQDLGPVVYRGGFVVSLPDGAPPARKYFVLINREHGYHDTTTAKIERTRQQLAEVLKRCERVRQQWGSYAIYACRNGA
jgi:hypothetical protein